MNLNKVEFYNVGAMEEIPGMGANGLMRIPVEVRNRLNERARFVGMDSIGTEIRFVTDAPNIDLYFSMTKPEFDDYAEVRIYKGGFRVKVIKVQPGIPFFCRLNPPPAFQVCSTESINDQAFSPNVWRVVCGNGTCVFHGIDVHGHEIRAPRTDELPRVNWLAYGSSITQSNLDGYIYFAATQLGWQVQNKGFSGACQAENCLADYLIDECEWDVITCELGINMRGCYTPEEFKLRVDYIIQRLVDIGKPALMIGVFPNCNTMVYTAEIDQASKVEASYNSIIEESVNAAGSPKIHFVPGKEILTELNGLSADLVHPTTYGHSLMGRNLAAALRCLME